MVRLRIGHARFRSPRKRWALAAVLWRYMAMKTRRVALLIAQRDTRHVLRSASATASCAGSWWSDDGGVAPIQNTVAVALFPDSLFSGCVATCQDPRRFITRLNGRPYLWCRCRLTMKSDKHWCLPSEYSPALIWPEKAHNDEGYVNIRVGIHTQTGCLESFLQFIDWVF